ncbi:MAG TPA: hypothetical protein PLC08_06255 [Candidatus Bipolaricaulis sp.]|nr:hypothetical protein [Candidatus Bipolaricaulis sp.]
MTKQKRFLLACALLMVCSIAVFSLSSRDYRVYWTARDGTVIGGVTPDGRLDTLSGAIHGGDVEIAGDLDVAGTLTTGSGLIWTPPLVLEGALSASGNVAFGASYNKFTIAAGTGNTAIAGTLGVTGLTTLTGGLKVPTGAGAYIVLGTAGDPQTPSAGTIVLWFDGTDLQVMNENGETVNLTNGSWSGE